MKLTDVIPIEKWIELEQEINAKFGLDSNVFDTAGVRISDFKKWVNRLCPEIKSTDKGQSFICATAHMNIAAQAKQRRQPVVEECDAGLVKIVVPIFCDDLFLGAVGACGLLLDDGEADSFLINKITDIEEDKVEALAEGIATISTDTADKVARFVSGKIEQMIADSKCNHHK